MGQEAIQNILQGLQLSQNAYAQHAQAQLEQQKITNEQAYREAQIKTEHERIANEHEYHQALVSQITQNMKTAKVEAERQAIQDAYQGRSPVGTTSTSPAYSSSNLAEVGPDQTRFQGVNPISGESFNYAVPSLTTQAQTQANLARITGAPAEEAKTREELAKQKAETERFKAQIELTQAAETERTRLIIAGENHRNDATTRTQLQIANLPYQFFNNMDPQTRAAVTQPSIDGIANGDMSAAQIQKEFNEKGMQGGGMAVIGAAMKNGLVPPTDKQVEFKKQIQPVIDTLPLIQQYIQMLPKTNDSIPGGVKAYVSGALKTGFLDTKLTALEKQIEFNIATVAKTVGGDVGQRLQKALLAPAEGGFMPDRFVATPGNVANYNKFLDVVNSVVNTQLSNLPQKEHIKTSMGLNGISKLLPDGTPVRQQQANQQQQTAPLSPQAQKIMQDLRIK